MQTLTDVAGNVFDKYNELGSQKLAEIFEGTVNRAYRLHLEPGDHAIDVGAHRGMHTIPMAAAVGSQGHVYAIEAAQETSQKLRAAINHADIEDCRKWITVIQKAVSDAQGTAIFNYIPEAAGLSGLREKAYPDHANKQTETVEVDTLDALIRDHERIRFIKLDIEGAEYHALCGGKELLRRAQPIFAMEFGNAGAAELYDFTREDFFGLMDELGYDLFTALGAPFTPSTWGRPAPWYLFGLPRSDPTAFHRIVQPAIALSLLDSLTPNSEA